MFLTIFWLSALTASISFLACESKLFQKYRDYWVGRSTFLGKLVYCGYCYAHWTAAELLILYYIFIGKLSLLGFWWGIDLFLIWLIISWFAGIQWALMCKLTEEK